jgi:hypothetical protein
MDELERIRKEAVVAKFKVLAQHFHGLRKTTKILSQDSRSPGRDLNAGPPEYEAEVLTTRSLRLVYFYIIFLCSHSFRGVLPYVSMYVIKKPRKGRPKAHPGL